MRISLRRADCLIEVHDARISSSWPPGQQELLPLPHFPAPTCPVSLQAAPSPHHLHSHLPQLNPQYLLSGQYTVTLLSSAHIPLSGRNPALQEALGIRPHVLVLNKTDLADPRRQMTVLEHLKQRGCSNIVFTDCQHDDNIKKIVPLVAKLVSNSPRYHRSESNEYNILVIGVPNVGKSSLINSLRRLHLKKGKATAVGGEPGVTKAVLTRIQVCEKPLMYLVDTPGVLPPKLWDVETGMKLALCGAIRDHLVGEDIMADYLLYTLNKRQQFGYVQRYGLAAACDNIEAVLRCVALTQARTQKVKVLTGTGNVNMMMLNYPAAAYKFLQDFRAGRLGRVTLD